MAVAPIEQFCKDHLPRIQRFHVQSGAARWGLSENGFAAALHRSAAARFADVDAATSDVERYLDSLFVEDLALASACEQGNQTAWLELLDKFRPVILAAARVVAKDSSRADELANGLYADLYGLEERDGRRRSLFSYFHGRSSLATWLRSVVARHFVNEHRATKRGETLRDRLVGEMHTEQTAPSEPPDPDRSRLAELGSRAFADAIGKLPARDRLRLASYYVQDLTLDEVGRLLGEHESTVSRKLRQTRQALRKDIEQRLRRDCGLSEEEVRDCYEAAIEGGVFDSLGKQIEQGGPSPTFNH